MDGLFLRSFLSHFHFGGEFGLSSAVFACSSGEVETHSESLREKPASVFVDFLSDTKDTNE